MTTIMESKTVHYHILGSEPFLSLILLAKGTFISIRSKVAIKHPVRCYKPLDLLYLQGFGLYHTQ